LPAAASSPDAVEALIKSQDPGALARAEALVEAQASNARAWVLLTRAQLQSDAADSPLVQDKSQWSGLIRLSYRF
ncbi:MAG: MipA/OmpV family protein, partial [Lysobacteraceae bacterium]